MPCLLELRDAFLRGASFLMQKDTKFQAISQLEKVRAASNPQATTLALYLQDREHYYISEIAAEATTRGARVMSYVFDGLYILASSEEHLQHVYEAVAITIFTRLGIQIALKSADGLVKAKLKFADLGKKKRPALPLEEMLEEVMNAVPRPTKSQRHSGAASG